MAKEKNGNGGSCLSRLAFHVLPGKTGEVEEELQKLAAMVAQAGGRNARVLHAHFASVGAPDVIFEQEAKDLAELESEMGKLTQNSEFQLWTKRMSGLLAESPKREIYLVRGAS